MTEQSTRQGPSALFTDLYQLTMAQAYLAEGMNDVAVFELFFRKMPANRNYVVASGIESVLDFLVSFGFSDDEIAYLRSMDQFDEAFLRQLSNIRFTGDVYSVPEGTPVFPEEPIVQVIAPIFEGQLVETFLLNQIHVHSVIATKAARVVSAAAGRTVVDFGARRAQGRDAALAAAWSTWLVGGAGTSNVEAARRFGIPAFGTMAHSYVQAHNDESEAFENFASTFPETTLLIDTYDTLDGVDRVIRLAEKLGDQFRVRAVRLDSGDLAALSKEVRRRLDAAGLTSVSIFASGGLDEFRIRELLDLKAPIDGFGVGTSMVVSQDAPSIDLAYKLVEYAGTPRTKLSQDKRLLPGRKQIFRRGERVLEGDILGLHNEDQPGAPLLVPRIHGGLRVEPLRLHELRPHCIQMLGRLPSELRDLDPAGAYPVTIGPALQAGIDEVQHRNTAMNP